MKTFFKKGRKATVYCWFLLCLFCSPLSELSAQPFDLLKEHTKYVNRLQEKAPILYQFEKRLSDITKEIQQTLDECNRGEITHEQAKEKLIPLIKAEMEIKNNPEYLAEQKLNIPECSGPACASMKNR